MEISGYFKMLKYDRNTLKKIEIRTLISPH